MYTDLVDPVGRLVVAMLTGMALGLNRDLHGKPTGIRTLGLVAFSSALITITMVRFLAPIVRLIQAHSAGAPKV